VFLPQQGEDSRKCQCYQNNSQPVAERPDEPRFIWTEPGDPDRSSRKLGHSDRDHVDHGHDQEIPSQRSHDCPYKRKGAKRRAHDDPPPQAPIGRCDDPELGENDLGKPAESLFILLSFWNQF
jgi:hypothetical protein